MNESPSKLKASEGSKQRQGAKAQEWLPKFWRWTGFGERTLWDYIGLVLPSVLVPIILGLWANYISIESRQQESLEGYYEQIGSLIIDARKDNQKPDREDVRKNVARARTLSTLNVLNGSRKGLLLRFLKDAELISTSDTFITLNRADLKNADLRGEDLQNTNLMYADMRCSHLKETKLNGANLIGASLNGIDHKPRQWYWIFKTLDFSCSYLKGSDLTKADLRGSDLREAKLTGVNLAGAIYTDNNTQKEVCKEINLKHPCPTKFSKFDPRDANMVLIKNLNDMEQYRKSINILQRK